MWSVCQRTAWGCLCPFQGLEESTEHPHSLLGCVLPHLQFLGWLLPAASSHWNASSSPALGALEQPQHCRELPPSQQTSGTAESSLVLWQFWCDPTSDTLTVASPPLSGGGFPGGFESLVCWCFVVSNAFPVFSMWKFSVSLGRGWALEKAVGLESLGFWYPWVGLEELLDHFTLDLWVKQGKRSMNVLEWCFVLLHKRARQLFLCQGGFIWARNLFLTSLMAAHPKHKPPLSCPTPSIPSPSWCAGGFLAGLWLPAELWGARAGRCQDFGVPVLFCSCWIMWCAQRGRWKSEVASSKNFKFLSC